MADEQSKATQPSPYNFTLQVITPDGNRCYMVKSAQLDHFALRSPFAPARAPPQISDTPTLTGIVSDVASVSRQGAYASWSHFFHRWTCSRTWLPQPAPS